MSIDVKPQAVHAYHALKRYLKMRMSAPIPIVVMRVRQVPTQVAYAATLGLPAPSSLETLHQMSLNMRTSKDSGSLQV